MTTLYRPVLIETIEQAEALPAGTSVKRAVWHESGDQDYCAGVKIGFNTWFTTSPTAERQDALSRHVIGWTSRHVVGWTALVPVEAEEGIDTIQTAGRIDTTNYDSEWSRCVPSTDE